MNSGAAAAAAALLLAACAAQPPVPGSFSFAVMGDVPYNADEERQFLRMMRRIDAEDLAFSVHVGDTRGKEPPCTDAFFERRRAQFDESRHPFLYTPGDNEWVECRDAAGRRNALERLARLREVYFAGRSSLGATRIATDVQDECLAPPVAGCGCGAHPENRAWSRAGVDFVTLHIVGEEDNLGRDAENDAEARCRREANRRWLERARRSAESAGAHALVVITQANPWNSLSGAYDDFIEQLERAARRLGRPLLLVHGETHTYRVDYPLPGVTRLETYGSPFVGWVKVTVMPGEVVPFRFESRLAAIVGRDP